MTEAENFSKLLRLIAKVGTMVIRELLHKYSSPMKFMDYLYHNQGLLDKLKLTDDQKDLLSNRDFEKMDITLLCKLVSNIFKDKMTAAEKQYLDKIKRERDLLLHSDILESCTVDHIAFKRKWQEISTILKCMALEIGRVDLQREIETMIEDTKKSSPTFSEVRETLIQLSVNNKQLTDKIVRLQIKFEEFEEKQTDVKRTTRQDAMIDKFRSHYEYNTKVDIQMTRKIEEALEHITNAFSVVLYGRPGEGKTAAAFKMVKLMIEDNKVKLEKCVLLSEPDDLKHIRSNELDLILIDDVFGRHNAEDDKISGWHNYMQTLQSFIGNQDVRVIIATRKHIYKESKHVLNEIEAFNKAVELSSNELSTNEKKRILISQLNYYSRNVDDVNIEKCIKQKESDAGFPLCAQQFSSDSTIYAKKEQYFASSYKSCLLGNLRNLDPNSFIALLYVFYQGNCLRQSEIDITTVDEQSEKKHMLLRIARLCGVDMQFAPLLKTTKKKLNALNGSYIKCMNKTFSFLHDTVYETVALIHGEENPSEVIKYCTLDFLCQCIRVQQGGIEDEIVIDYEDYKFLVQRCIDVVVEQENGKRLAKHPMFACEGFVNKFFEIISKDDTSIKNFFSTGLSFAYYGIHAFLYHIIKNNIGNSIFVMNCLDHLKCQHESSDTESCWKCPVKSEALVGACYADQYDIYENLRNAGANVTPICLYEATLNQYIGPRVVKRIIEDLKQANITKY